MHTPSPPHADAVRGLLAALAVVVFWSGFNIVSRFGATASFTPFDIAALRFGVSGAIALPLYLRFVPRRDWPRHMVLAAVGGLGYGLLVYSGFAFAPSAHAGVFVNGGIPFWTIVIMAVMSGFRIARPTVIALALSTCGLLLIGFESLLAPTHGREWVGDLLFFSAALCWAVFGLLMRRWQIKPQLGILGIASFSALAYLPVYLLWLPANIAAASWGEIALQGVYQGIVASMLAAGFYSYAVQKVGASEASMMLALVPAFTAIGAFFILGEALGLSTIIGIAVVSVGALLGALPPAALARLRALRSR
ncbi:MAG TPA: DMT family transporter [Thauera sp.]|uniref:DMT family transporter n=1 Tax=Thauera sp. WB-2 TaxID=2897772 RepID=UPI0022DE4DF2|nr:DMT family transporter [Thauera sp. WB-2]WBL64602.1 DMT family transporter [Thauera sp. WB-2]HNR61479.1 DMT family transporter [Thauera sp.]HRK12057.1 DMT family transporter [Thauera sp.]